MNSEKRRRMRSYREWSRQVQGGLGGGEESSPGWPREWRRKKRPRVTRRRMKAQLERGEEIRSYLRREVRDAKRRKSV